MSALLATQSEPAGHLYDVAKRGRLFAILDACDAPTVPPKVHSLGADRGLSLFRGDAEEAYADIAPYLVVVDSTVLEWISATMSSEPWGIFAESEASLEELRKHFRRFLTVRSPDDDAWYFRYYDPRVLVAFLPTCTKSELSEFFGPVIRYGTTRSEDGSVMWMRPGDPARGVTECDRP